METRKSRRPAWVKYYAGRSAFEKAPRNDSLIKAFSFVALASAIVGFFALI